MILLFALNMSAPALADAQADKEAIASRLHQWVSAFNRRDAAGTCDIFAANLVSSVPGALEVGRDEVCARLAAILARRDRPVRYEVFIREILVDGDLAVVRLLWTLSFKQGPRRQTSQEVGMDIFQRQAGGTWSIIRFLALPVDSKP